MVQGWFKCRLLWKKGSKLTTPLLKRGYRNTENYMILIFKNSSIDLILAKFRGLSIWSVCFLSYSYLLFLDFFPSLLTTLHPPNTQSYRALSPSRISPCQNKANLAKTPPFPPFHSPHMSPGRQLSSITLQISWIGINFTFASIILK